MKIIFRKNALMVCVLLCLLGLAGCASSYLVPKLHALANKDARIELINGEIVNTAWRTDHLSLDYSLSGSGDSFIFDGTMKMGSSVIGSFSVVESFSLKLNFLDDQGRVLATHDISPLLGMRTMIPEKSKVKAKGVRPPGAKAIAFNYFGLFKDNAGKNGSIDWEIFYFPFEQTP